MEQPITTERSCTLVQLAYFAALEFADARGLGLREVMVVRAEPTEHGFRASVTAHHLGCLGSFAVSERSEEHASPAAALGELADKARAAGRGA